MPNDHGLSRLTTSRRRVLDRLLDRLLNLDAAARSLELAEIGKRAPRIHLWLTELLAASTQPTHFLDTMFERVGQAATREVRSMHEVLLPAGTRLGSWRVEEPVGSGGMGTVYRAERADGAFSMSAAIKLIRLRREDLDERLKLERELLARLDHRNIARLIDGGTTADGQAYLVMEWVEGRDLDDCLREKAPNRAAILELFAQVADAVSHAHRRRVVHGDLKPANIRVTGEGEVRLLDFGVARLVEAGSESGAPANMAMTPAFSAPEQLRGEAVSTLTDVWSLGVLLAWMLSGRVPDRDRPVADLLPVDLSGRRDLHAIVSMACAEDPDHRYDGIPQFMEDVERFQYRHPLRARKASRSYLLRRFIQRHHLPVAAGSAALLAIGLALAGALWQWQVAGGARDRAQIERDRAELEAGKSREVSNFLVGLFEQADPGTARGEDVTARQLLEAGIERADELDGQPAVQSRMYRVLARVQMNLGDYESARALAQSAMAVHETESGELSPDAAATLVQLGDIHLQKGEPAEAINYYRRGLDKLTSLESELGVEALLGFGGALTNSGDRLEEAIEVLERALAVGRRVVPGTPLVAAIHNNLGGAAYYDGRYGDATVHFDRAIDLLIDHFGTDHPRVFFSQTNLAYLLMEQARYDEAEATLVGLIDAQERMLGAGHPHRAANLNTMGSLHWRQERTEQAIEWWEQALDARVAAFGTNHADVAGTQSSLALAVATQGDVERAESLYEQALVILRDPDAARTIRLPATLANLAELRISQGRHDEALQLHHEALDLLVELTGSRHAHVGISHRKIAALHLAADEAGQARKWASSSLDILRDAYPDRPHPEIDKTASLLERIDTRRADLSSSQEID